MNAAPIGIMDSGSGGLSIWRAVTLGLPHESTVYVGDHANLPYSEKTTGYIRRRVTLVIEFLRSRGAKLVVIACNTATVAGIDTYRRLFPQLSIIGVVPVVKTAARTTKTGCFAVLSTPYTARSLYQKNLIRTFASGCTVYNLGCPDLVRMVERGIVSGGVIRGELKKILAALAGKNVDVVALGCTHFPFLRDAITQVVSKKVTILDSGGAVARQVERILTQNGELSTNSRPIHEFFTTGDARRVGRVARKLLQRQLHIAYAAI